MRTTVFSLLLLMIGLVTVPIHAQSNDVAEKQKAVLSFDVRFDKIRNSQLAKSLKIEEQLSQWAAMQGDDGPDPTKLDRIWGAFSAPENMETAQGLASGQLPMEFFVMMKFKESADVDKLMETIKKDNSESFEKNGQTFYRPPQDGSTPEAMILHRFDDKTVEIGTESYLFLNDRKVFTGGLEDAWSKVPDEAIRLAMDLDGAKGLIAEAVAMGKQGGDPMMGAYLDLIDNAKNMRLSIDLSGENLLTLAATGVDSDQAEELRGGLDALLGIAKMGGQMQVAQVKQMDEGAGAALETILKSLVAKADGAEVSVVIPKPAGFDDAIKGAVEKMQGGFNDGN